MDTTPAEAKVEQLLTQLRALIIAGTIAASISIIAILIVGWRLYTYANECGAI
jgi:type IV secretory pathway VirB2 component (pilin)